MLSQIVNTSENMRDKIENEASTGIVWKDQAVIQISYFLVLLFKWVVDHRDKVMLHDPNFEDNFIR